MEFIDHLKEWYARCINAKTAMKTLNFEETIPWKVPLDQQNPEQTAKTTIQGLGHTQRGKPQTIQLRMSYPKRGKIYYIGLKCKYGKVIIECFHETQFNESQMAHCWKPTICYANLTVT